MKSANEFTWKLRYFLCMFFEAIARSGQFHWWYFSGYWASAGISLELVYKEIEEDVADSIWDYPPEEEASEEMTYWED